VSVSVLDGSLTTSPHGEYILFVNTRPEVDFISYDPFTYGRDNGDTIKKENRTCQNYERDKQHNKITAPHEGRNPMNHQLELEQND